MVGVVGGVVVVGVVVMRGGDVGPNVHLSVLDKAFHAADDVAVGHAPEHLGLLLERTVTAVGR